jgi:hypothetical protein
MIGGWRLIVMSNVTKKTTVINNPNQVITTSDSVPDEGPVLVDSTFQPPADEPYKIRIPEIDVEGYIQKVGTELSDNIATPSSIFIAGWYVKSIKPGESEGLSIINGHVHGVYKPGIFFNLKELSVGSVFNITYGDGHSYNFKVKSVLTKSIQEAANILFAKDSTIKSQLNLITCGGKYDSNSKTYDQRVIVISEKI